MIGGDEEFVNRFRNLGLSGSPQTPVQIADLEQYLGLSLPAAYVAYLRIAGESPPPELVGSDCHGTSLYQLRRWADELLVDSGRPYELPADAVVFLMHQGYQFFYFRADGVADDPAVFYYFENRPAAKQCYDRFSDWVAACVS